MGQACTPPWSRNACPEGKAPSEAHCERSSPPFLFLSQEPGGRSHAFLTRHRLLSQPLTRWEKFAKEKGINKKKKDLMIYDEQSKEFKPRYGYKRCLSSPIPPIPQFPPRNFSAPAPFLQPGSIISDWCVCVGVRLVGVVVAEP